MIRKFLLRRIPFRFGASPVGSADQSRIVEVSVKAPHNA